MNAREIKIKSEKEIQKLGLIGNFNLPEIEPFEALIFRDSNEIAKRILVLAYIYGISFGVKRKKLKRELKKFNLYEFLSESEKKILSKLFITKQDKANVEWLIESIEILGWSIGLWSSIPIMKQCDENRQADNVPLRKSPDKFISEAKLISKQEIYKKADLIYRLHWVAKNEKIAELGKYANDVYMERHKAINWIIFGDTDWDEIETDT